MSAVDDLLKHNAAYRTRFSKGELGRPPRKRLAIVTCMDARIETRALLGLEEGDAHVFRNAGGVVTEDVLRSLTISQQLLGTREIMVIHHTGCGMLSFTDDELTDRLERETGTRPEFPFRAFDDLEGSVRDAVAQIRECPFIPHTDTIRGFVYEVETGGLREVK